MFPISAMEPEIERRASARYQLQAPVIFQFKGANQLMMQGAGFVRNISTSGVFIWTRTVPPSEQDLEIEVMMPHLEKVIFALRSTGRIIRVEPNVGFAAAADFTFNRMP
jgi:hypothetical protein